VTNAALAGEGEENETRDERAGGGDWGVTVVGWGNIGRSAAPRISRPVAEKERNRDDYGTTVYGPLSSLDGPQWQPDLIGPSFSDRKKY
jgi:hypothetical protein